MLRREIVRDRSQACDGRDGMLEDQMVGAFDLDDEGEAIEALDASLEVPAVHEMNADRQPITPRVIQEDVLNVGLRWRGRQPGFGNLSHQGRLLPALKSHEALSHQTVSVRGLAPVAAQRSCSRPTSTSSVSSTRRNTSGRSPGPS